MGRLKKYKFDTFDDFLDHQEKNLLLVSTTTVEKLEKYYEKNKSIGLVDIFEVELGDYNNGEVTKMSIFEHEWDSALEIALTEALKVEDYMFAKRVQNLQEQIKK